MGGQHDNGLLRCGGHGVVFIEPGRDMLIAFSVGNGGGDIAFQQCVIRRMFQNQICFDLHKKFIHHRRLPSLK